MTYLAVLLNGEVGLNRTFMELKLGHLTNSAHDEFVLIEPLWN